MVKTYNFLELKVENFRFAMKILCPKLKFWAEFLRGEVLVRTLEIELKRPLGCMKLP